ncbi:MAG TPA: prolyl aminopeptidase [Alphaproteobacteria bacterium]|nr:prolyl aminopeptidase [Alphaproteobacteria bacterium]
MPQLTLSHGHTMHYTEHGNPKGAPVVYLHGGPGSGSKASHTRYFNLKSQWVILYDQRGCGRSTPLGQTKHNTTQLLIEDLERLRSHLNIQKWQVVGFSWGSTLALAYAQAYPKRVSGLTIGAVYLGTKAETEWLTQPTGAAMFYPAEYAAATALAKPGAVLKALAGSDKKRARQVAEAWTLFDALTMEFEPDAAAIKASLKADAYLPTRMKVMHHYFANNCFFTPNQLLKGAAKLKNIPLHIVQAHYDMCTPPAAALALHKALPGSTLTMVTHAGHRATPPVQKARIAAVAQQARALAKGK